VEAKKKKIITVVILLLVLTLGFYAGYQVSSGAGEGPSNAVEQYKLAEKLFNSEQVEYQKKALKWLKKSANKGYVEAQKMLGILYYKGYEEIGIKENKKEAFKWFQKAANQGDEDAIMFINFLH
jgi:TPR repeat protein